ncbi:MAG: ATP-binding cassette domain-containing protein [Betaproteobacteria bacterium]
MSAEPLIALTDLQAGYDRPVVGPVCLHVAPGEVVALWGPNGCGKTTLLNAVGGGARVFSGTLVRRPGLRVAHQHQNPLPLHNVPLSGRELLGLTRADPGSLPDSARPLLSRRLSELSGGQLQFLQVWASLASPAALVLLDEPTNNVDPGGVALLEAALQGREATRGFVIVSHDRRFVESVATRVVELPRP